MFLGVSDSPIAKGWTPASSKFLGPLLVNEQYRYRISTNTHGIRRYLDAFKARHATSIRSSSDPPCTDDWLTLRVCSAHPTLPSSTADGDVDQIWREGTARVTTGGSGTHENWCQRPINTVSPVLLADPLCWETVCCPDALRVLSVLGHCWSSQHIGYAALCKTANYRYSIAPQSVGIMVSATCWYRSFSNLYLPPYGL